MQVLRSRNRATRIGVASTLPGCEKSREPSLEEHERTGKAVGHRHRTAPVLHAEQRDELSRTLGRALARCLTPDGIGVPVVAPMARQRMPFRGRGQRALRTGKDLGRALRCSADRIGVFVLHGRLGVIRVGG